MPSVGLEGPVAEERMRDKLARAIGLRDFQNHRYDELASEGIFETTVVVFGAIPPQYLKRLQ
jgi:uncharacterized protein YutE (UPF0331/DUF86 family)